MSTPVRGPDGPLGYAPRWARASSGGRADAAFDARATRSLAPVQELAPQQDLKPPRVVMPAVVMPAREAAFVRNDASEPGIVPPRNTASERGTVTRDIASQRDTPQRDIKPSHASATVQTSASDPPWKRKKRPPIFEGDTAMRELRSRLALAPDQMPEPPLYQVKAPIFAVVVRLMGVMVLAAGGALGFLWITAPHAAPPDNPLAGRPGGEVALVSYRSVEVPQRPPAAEDVKAARAPDATPSHAPWAVANYTRDLTDGVGTPPAALAPRTSVPATPRVPAPRVSTPTPPAAVAPPPAAVAAPPPAAVAPSSAAVPSPTTPVPAVAAPIRAPASPPAVTATADRDEVTALLTRARAYLSAGDIAAARLVLRRAAERDDAQAALALGGTYDPTVLKRLGIINFHADPTQARDWYRRAVELGSPDASLRLEQLVQTDR